VEKREKSGTHRSVEFTVVTRGWGVGGKRCWWDGAKGTTRQEEEASDGSQSSVITITLLCLQIS
jgi:hypothetical protein